MNPDLCILTPLQFVNSTPIRSKYIEGVSNTCGVKLVKREMDYGWLIRHGGVMSLKHHPVFYEVTNSTPPFPGFGLWAFHICFSITTGRRKRPQRIIAFDRKHSPCYTLSPLRYSRRCKVLNLGPLSYDHGRFNCSAFAACFCARSPNNTCGL